MERVIEFKVCFKEWDQGYQTFYDRPLFTTNSYEAAEKFAKSYEGTETVFIEKYFVNPNQEGPAR